MEEYLRTRKPTVIKSGNQPVTVGPLNTNLCDWEKILNSRGNNKSQDKNCDDKRNDKRDDNNR